MEQSSRKAHWEKVFTSKAPTEVSWYQPVPQPSLDFIRQLKIPKEAAVIDVGGGDSFLVDHLIDQGFTNITVLDISSAAIERAKARLGSRSGQVNWIVADVLTFTTDRKYDCWHDRAVFHFLTTAEEQSRYLEIAGAHIRNSGKMIMGTFAEAGPDKCSGLPVKQYNEISLSATLKNWFAKITCITTEHLTPFKTVQQFLFCSFQKKPVYGHT